MNSFRGQYFHYLGHQNINFEIILGWTFEKLLDLCLCHYIKYLNFWVFRKMLLTNVAQNLWFPLRNGLRIAFLGQNQFSEFLGCRYNAHQPHQPHHRTTYDFCIPHRVVRLENAHHLTEPLVVRLENAHHPTAPPTYCTIPNRTTPDFFR